MSPHVNANTCMHDRLDYEQHPNLFVHVKVSKLVEFDRLIPNYVATGSKKGTETVPNQLSTIVVSTA